MDNTATYIKALVTPQAKKAGVSRKVWSIDLETVWLPFFTATNVMGDTAIPSDALGAPLRLAYNKDGTVKFSQSGRPVVRVVKTLSDSVRMVRENFVAGLQAYAIGVATENPDGFKVELTKSREAGMPIVTRNNEQLKSAYAEMVAEQVEAQQKAETQAQTNAVAEAEAIVKANTEPSTTEPTTTPEPKTEAKRKAHRAPKAQTEPPAIRDGQNTTDGNPNEQNATEPVKEPVLVS